MIARLQVLSPWNHLSQFITQQISVIFILIILIFIFALDVGADALSISLGWENWDMAALGKVNYLYDLVVGGKASEVADFIADNPDVDLHAADLHQWSPFVRSLWHDSPAILDIFLRHCPARVDVNRLSSSGWPPVMHGIANDASVPTLQRLLACPLVKSDFIVLTPGSSLGWTPFALAACRSLGMMKLLIGSGRPLGWTPDDKMAGFIGSSTLPCIISSGQSDGFDDVEARQELLGRFIADPGRTRYLVQLDLAEEHGCSGDAVAYAPAVAAAMFACVVFLCDGILGLSKLDTTLDQPRARSLRFFLLCSKLPLELQMLLCHRVASSGKDSILCAQSEIAFRHLASLFLSL